MNLLVATLVFCAILFIGWYFYNKTQKKSIFYADFLQFCEFLKNEIGFFQNNLKEILSKKEYNSSEFNSLIEDFKNNENIEIWCKEQKILDSNEVAQIKNFFAKLGRLDVQSQTNEIETFLKYLEEKISDIKTKHLKKAKLTFSLSIMLGLFAFIIII